MRVNILKKLLVACSLVLAMVAGLFAGSLDTLRGEETDQSPLTLLVGKNQFRGYLVEKPNTGFFLNKGEDITFVQADSGLVFRARLNRISSLTVASRQFPDNGGPCAGEKELSLILQDARTFQVCHLKDYSLEFDSNGIIILPLYQSGEVKIVQNETPPALPGLAGNRATGRAQQPPPTKATDETQVAKASIERIRHSRHAPMPVAQATPASAGGGTSMLVDNDTLYNLTVYLSGPASRVIKVAPKSTQTVPLEAGHYEVAAKVSNSAVVPFYGVADYGPDIQYSEKFYIQTRVH